MLVGAQKQLPLGHGQRRVDRLADLVARQRCKLRPGRQDKRATFEIADVELAIGQQQRAPQVAAQPFLPDLLARGRFETLDEAIRIANATDYGLSSAVCTNRLDYITRLVSELQVGTVNVREVPGYRLELTPFGGIKDSGLGYKEGVQEAMKSFTNLKTYSLPWK